MAFTNAIALSPKTDTMPMAGWAKLMMATQSLVAITTIALVFTRAVSVLNGPSTTQAAGPQQRLEVAHQRR